MKIEQKNSNFRAFGRKGLKMEKISVKNRAQQSSQSLKINVRKFENLILADFMEFSYRFENFHTVLGKN